MASKKAKKIQKHPKTAKSSAKSLHSKKSAPKPKIKMHAAVHHEPHHESYKEGLLSVDKTEEKYDKLFEQKLAEQYREFRNLKEHSLQSKKFLGIMIVVVVIILAALVILSY